MKKNKTFLSGVHRPLIKQDYFNWIWSTTISQKYWYDINLIQKYLRSSATKNYTRNWRSYRRCTVCNVYRVIEDYSSWNWYYKAYCHICDARYKKNRYILDRNLWNTEGKKLISKKTWNKHKQKYNLIRIIRRRVWVILK